MFRTLLADEAGFVVSAELVLIATIVVIGLIVGLSEVQHAVVSELNDVANSVGSLNQGYMYTGFSSHKQDGRLKSAFSGSSFHDGVDACDNNSDIACDAPMMECMGYGNND
ncbi:MAG: hypothetical protein KDA80_17215 [Planctomycetaceae bacterium]|nr:hypothetical protein [Planctomycetaceae bacterium]